MPADKYDFAPTAGSFGGQRRADFLLEQVRHLSTVIYMLSGAVLGEKPPVNIGKDDSGSGVGEDQGSNSSSICEAWLAARA